jgi:hypothetical protein
MNSKIRIKVISRGNSAFAVSKQLPASGSFTGQCSFSFDHDDSPYDWLAVIDDVSRKLRTPPIILRCADEHTLLITTEPPTITQYGKAFAAQFSHILTSQPPEDLNHHGRIYSHTGNLWFNGLSYDKLLNKGIPEKSLPLSTVCSSKQQKHTIHNDRYQFCNWLTQQLPTMDLFGHGSRFIKHKYDALDPYRFHLAIENYSGLHHWTEKLADSFLSGCFPIYYGCTNAADYFPQDSFMEIDIFDRQGALEKIRSVIEDEAFYASRKDVILESRKLIMEDYNLLRMIESIALQHYQPARKSSGRRLFGRKQMRCRRPADAARFAAWHLKRHIR